MRPLLPVVILTLLAGLATAAPVPKAVKKLDDKSAIVGTWTVTDLTVNSRKVDISYKTFTFDAEGKVTLRYAKDAGNGSSWTWTIDDSTTPRRMQWTTQPGRNDWDLVYEVDGDSLKVGFIAKGSKPPTAVEPGDGLTLYIMTRDTTK